MSNQSAVIKVLVVEDNPGDARLIREMLGESERVRFDVECAGRLSTGLARLTEENVDVLLLDLGLPDSVGFETFAKAHAQAPNVPIIVLSGLQDEAVAVRAVREGAQDYLGKGETDRRLLTRSIRYAIARKWEEQQQQLRLQAAALAAAANGIAITDKDGCIVWANPAFTRLTGYALDEVRGQTPRFLKSGKQDRAFYEQLWNTITSGQVWHGEIVNRRKDDTLYTEEMTITPVRDQHGKTTHYVAIKQDVTARQRAEEERERLAAVLDATPDFVAIANSQGRVLYVNRAGRTLLRIAPDDDFAEVRMAAGHPEWARKVVLETAVPAALRDGVWTGETAFLDGKGREIPFSQVILAHKGPDDQFAFLSTIARDISVRKEQELRILRLSRVHAVLSGINTAIVRLRDRKELFAEACRIAVDQGQFRMAWIGLLEPAGGVVVPAAKAGFEEGYLEQIDLRLDESSPETCKLVARALREKAPVVSNDIGSDPRMARWRNEALRRGFRSAVVFPLLVDDEAIGVFVLYAGEVDFFDTEEMRLLTGLAADVSFALAYIANAERLAYLACFDTLTGLPNRTLFYDRLNQMLHAANQDEGVVAVLAVDLERFRDLNESYGRLVGDAVLVEAAKRLGAAVQDAQHLARMGSNSFGVVLANLRQAAEVAHALEERIFEILDRPYEVDGEELHPKTRVGIALFPTDGADAATLVRNAETALGKAKRSGGRYLFYTPALNATVADKLTLERRLRRALELDQFVLHYQPKVDVKSGKISGLEALLRWNDPETGLVPPMKFIPLLEETGMISAVGRWALTKALADSLAWQQKGLPALRVAVNVSAMQLRESDFVDAIARVLAGAEGTAGGLELEITESMIMEEIEAIIPKLRSIREMGVQVAIDDFGTGYSSLSYLARLPINALKIDRAFIMNMTRSPDDVAIVSTIISLAHSLSLQVVAEGVETIEQAKLLRLLRCDEIQGFLFSPGVPAERIEALQREGRSLSS